MQYVRRRNVIRLVNANDGRSGTLEVPLPAFFEALGVEAADLIPPSLFLLFASPHGVAIGGLGDLIATYQTEVDARTAFHGLRASGDYGKGWAELDEMGANGCARALAWFGRAPAREQGYRRRFGSKFARKDPRQRGALAVR